MLGNYFHRELQRMPAMDIADVAYDYFLANGRPETNINANRRGNGASEDYQRIRHHLFSSRVCGRSHDNYLQPMVWTVQPLEEQRFLIAVAETYDVLLKIPPSNAYELRATAHDAFRICFCVDWERSTFSGARCS